MTRVLTMIHVWLQVEVVEGTVSGTLARLTGAGGGTQAAGGKKTSLGRTNSTTSDR